MNRRKKSSGGQAIVMVTLALVAMAGMMGLAVDLGWSFFVEKEAQAAADGAALAAIQEAVARVSAAGVSPSSTTCGTNADCQTTAISCASVGTTSNLNNGCQYALKNGFNWTAGSHQNVTMQSNVVTCTQGVIASSSSCTNLPPTAPGVFNLTYWVTVRTVQTIPQLFSAVLGNTQGTVSAIATAAIAGAIKPGSFFGMNRRGDCFTASDGTTYCGVDVQGGTGAGGIPCPGAPGGSADVCAPAGLILASNCATASDGCSNSFAGAASKGAWGSSLLIMGGPPENGAVTGSWPTPSYSTNTASFIDPTSTAAGGPGSQPPLQVTSAMRACGVPGGTIASGTLGPYQYYAMDSKTLLPTGAPITIGGKVSFSAAGSCPGTLSPSGISQASSDFPSYIFWGGMNIQAQTNFGPGQYIMAGVASNAPGATVFNVSGNFNVTGDSTTGTMFIFTDGSYPGLATQATAIPGSGSMPALYQGTLGFKDANMTLNGLVNSSAGSNLPAAMNAYTGIAWWQDRRNSNVGYNEASGSSGCNATCTGDDGSVISCAMGCVNGTSTTPNFLATANHVTSTSPGVVIDPGKGNLGLNGVFYQPRGAWIEFVHGTTGVSCGSGNCPLQVITGSLIEDTGDTGMLLNGPTNPLITYKATLIQ
jgi:Flp pilus assembly protein TadG